MESVGQTMSHMNRARQFNPWGICRIDLGRPRSCCLYQGPVFGLNKKFGRSISKFNQYISERKPFLIGRSDYIAKGYKAHPHHEWRLWDVAYEETPELIEAQKRAAINQRLNLINLPSTLKEASLAKVELDDKDDLRLWKN